MRVLLLDTCGAEGTVALADSALTEAVVAQVTMPGRAASERLVVVVREMLKDADWKLRDLAAIGVVTGPGSFTGVRVGLSVAKGLGEASGVPLIAVSRLAMLAAQDAPPVGGRVCALLDAGRDEFYCGQYESGADLGETLISHVAAISVGMKANAVVVCEGTAFRALKEAVVVRMVAEPVAANALPFVLRCLAEASFDDPLTLDANYLRRTDAEIFAKPAVKLAG